MKKKTLFFSKIPIFRIMKIYVVLLCFTLIKAFATDVRAQSISLDITNTKLKKILVEIEKKSDYSFFYNSSIVDVDRKTSVNVENAEIDYVLELLFSNMEIDFSFMRDQIVLFPKNNPELKAKIEGLLRKNEEQVYSTMAPEKINDILITSLQATITGKVVDAITGTPIPGASVLIEGTTTGTATDFEGGYSINASPGDILVFSFIGMSTQTITVGNSNTINVQMHEDASQLDEVVLTALGIDRDKDAIGYSVTEINELDDTNVVNVANVLAGKVAGVTVSQAASGTGGSVKVLIRGNNSLVGNSQPLYVIDGIPLSNDVFGEAGRWGGTDYGDGISNINQEDIETITVLKGPNAASLYGQRGSNGVILITTKSGKAGKVSVTFNSNLSIGNAAVLPDFQNEYGQGFNGEFTHIRAADGTFYSWEDAQAMNITGTPKMSAGRNRLTRGSWGARYDGLPHEDQFGNVLPYVAQPNTYQDFFQPEINRRNTLSVSGGSEKVNYFMSYTNLRVDGYVPTNTIDRNSFNLRTRVEITPKLKADVKFNYIVQQAVNRPTLSDGVDNPVYLLMSQPRSMYASVLQDFAWTEDGLSRALGVGRRAVVGNEKTYATNGSTANQYWTINKQRNSDRKDRILASVNLRYDPTDFININLRGGTDSYTEQRFRYRDIGTRRSRSQNGDISEIVNRVREDNFDVLATFKHEFNEKMNFQINAGASHQKRFLRRVGFRGEEFQVPGLFSINNTLNQFPTFNLRESVINSVYGAAQFSYNNYFYLDLTARNDWSSTLPLNDNSFFYPSASASFVLSDALDFPQNGLLSYLKLRGSVAQAGSSGSPYQLFGSYFLNSVSYDGRPRANFSNVIPDPNLDNELTTSYEFGADLKLLGNRAEINFTYYSASTKNQILDVPLPRSTNFSGTRINAGEITNKGIELLLTATPISSKNGLTWDTSFNFGRNVNEVVSLTEGVDVLILGRDRNVDIVAIPGKSFGQIFGTSFAWQKDDAGNRLIDPDTGLPIRTDGKVSEPIGNALPDWTGGFSNTFSYKNFTLGALVEISQGGQIFSQSTREQILYGLTKKTLPGRDGTYVADGVIAQQNPDGSWSGTGAANTIQVTAQDYWGAVANTKDNLVSEEMLNDASYISMREMTLSYRFPSKFIDRTPFNNMSIGLFGRNLFYFQRNTDGFAPEASTFNVNNSSLGLESTSLPLLRTIGINLNVEF